MIVTHQKRTMDAADVLYGVTMGDDGVTKVVSRRLPREEAAEEETGSIAQGPPPFAGIAAGEEPSEEPGDTGTLGSSLASMAPSARVSCLADTGS